MGRVWLLNITVINEIYLLLSYCYFFIFRFTASHEAEYFNGSAIATASHDTLQTVDGNRKCFNEFTPVSKVLINTLMAFNYDCFIR